jgi:hypothetical protein
MHGPFCGGAGPAPAGGYQPPNARARPPAPGQKYMCPPCGCAADGKRFDAPGACPECGMPLVPAPADAPKGDAPAPPKLAAAQTIAAKAPPA